jgi:putative hydrolase of the HAD superfamily
MEKLIYNSFCFYTLPKIKIDVVEIMNFAGINTILFDLDDTLLAFDAVTEPSWRQVCHSYCTQTDSISPEKLYQVITSHSNLFWSTEERHRIGRLDIVNTRRKVVGAAFKELGLPMEGAMGVADHFSKLRIENMYLLPEAVQTLSYLYDKGIKLGLLTNGDSQTQRGKIERFKLGNYFEHIFIEGEVGFGKPDERAYKNALQVLEANPHETVMVGDNLKWDVFGPQALGICGIWYNWKGVALPEELGIKPDATITRLSEILDLTMVSG